VRDCCAPKKIKEEKRNLEERRFGGMTSINEKTIHE